jgi:hypothetical protein
MVQKTNARLVVGVKMLRGWRIVIDCERVAEVVEESSRSAEDGDTRCLVRVESTSSRRLMGLKGPVKQSSLDVGPQRNTMYSSQEEKRGEQRRLEMEERRLELGAWICSGYNAASTRFVFALQRLEWAVWLSSWGACRRSCTAHFSRLIGQPCSI